MFKVRVKNPRTAKLETILNEYLRELAVEAGLGDEVIGKVHEDSLRFDGKLRMDVEL